MLIYPNPSSSTITIEHQFSDELIEVYTLEGKLILTEKTEGSKTTINLEKGIYIVRISEAVKKVVIQ